MIQHLLSKISSKLSAIICPFVRNCVLRILHYVVLPIIGLSGSGIARTGQNSTLWHSWTEYNKSALIQKQSGKSWLVHYVTFLFASKNFWMLSLLPFIIILKSVERHSDAPATESLLMYTLY